MNKKNVCKTELEPNAINEKVFEKEIKLYEKLSHENNGSCGWGKCENCGVIPFLYKLHRGELLENASDILKAKQKAGIIFRSDNER